MWNSKLKEVIIPWDILAHGDHLLFKWFQCYKFDVCHAKDFQDTKWAIFPDVHSSSKFALVTSKSIKEIYFIEGTSVLSLMSTKQRVIKLLNGQYLPTVYVQNWLTLNLVTSKSKGPSNLYEKLVYQVWCL